MMTADKEPTLKEFGALVRERRISRGWTQEVLADVALSNIDRKGYISNIENGKIPNITSETVRKVVQALDINIHLVPKSMQWPSAEQEAYTQFFLKELQIELGKTLDRLIAELDHFDPHFRRQAEQGVAPFLRGLQKYIDDEAYRTKISVMAEEFERVGSKALSGVQELIIRAEVSSITVRWDVFLAQTKYIFQVPRVEAVVGQMLLSEFSGLPVEGHYYLSIYYNKDVGTLLRDFISHGIVDVRFSELTNETFYRFSTDGRRMADAAQHSIQST